MNLIYKLQSLQLILAFKIYSYTYPDHANSGLNIRWSQARVALHKYDK